MRSPDVRGSRQEGARAKRGFLQSIRLVLCGVCDEIYFTKSLYMQSTSTTGNSAIKSLKTPISLPRINQVKANLHSLRVTEVA
jgi:hypothetical protein